MRTKVARGAPSMGTGWSSHRRKVVLDIDINIPPCSNANEVGTSSYVHVEAEAARQVAPVQPVSIDVDSIDDDVVLVSPRAFVEATKKSTRNRRRNNAVDIETGLQARHCNKRGRESTNKHIINCESYIDLESSGYTVNGNDKNLSKQPKDTNLQLPQDSTFSCPICLGTLVEETSTKCGHIFCKTCLKQAIAAQGKCPTCRKKVTIRNIFRIYLPATKFS